MDPSLDPTPSPNTVRWRRAKLGIVAGLVAGAIASLMMVLSGIGGAAAQTADPARPQMIGMGHGPKGFGMGGIHGEFTTRAPGGGYQTIATQNGEVTAVSASSITVKSEDGYTRTYGVDDNTLVNAGNNGIADVKTGDTVRVTAIVSGNTRRAVDIVDGTNVQASRGRWMPPRPPASQRSHPPSRSDGSTSHHPGRSGYTPGRPGRFLV